MTPVPPMTRQSRAIVGSTWIPASREDPLRRPTMAMKATMAAMAHSDLAGFVSRQVAQRWSHRQARPRRPRTSGPIGQSGRLRSPGTGSPGAGRSCGPKARPAKHPRSEHIGEEPGGTGDGDDVADAGSSGPPCRSWRARGGQPDTDGQVGDPHARSPPNRHRCHSAASPSTATPPTVRRGRPYLDHRRQRVATQLPFREEPANGGNLQLRTIGRGIRLEMRITIGRGSSSASCLASSKPSRSGSWTSSNTTSGEGADDRDGARGVRHAGDHVEAHVAEHRLAEARISEVGVNEYNSWHNIPSILAGTTRPQPCQPRVDRRRRLIRPGGADVPGALPRASTSPWSPVT